MPVPVADLGALLAAGSLGPADVLVDSARPLALLPVRLETRLFATGGQAEVRIRVYPDKIHLDAHDPDLTVDEVAAGQRYWQLQWQAGADNAGLQQAWQALADRFGPARAAWIARRLTPTNAAERPGGMPRFPDPGPPATGQRVPRVRLLPDRWVATAFANGAALATATGRDIVADLAVGPDLTAPVTITDEQPAIDDGMQWMIDFDRAEQVGMALRLTVPIPPVVDLLLVTGVSARDRSADLAAQLDAHHYTDGLAFLPAGTPTNNTAAGRTLYRAADPARLSSYAVELAPDPLESGSAGDVMRSALGVDAFAHVAGAHDTEERAASAMAVALWPVTWGYFLAQMIGFAGTGLTVASRDLVRDHALTYVRPGGPLPTLRVGAQPYGVLPVTSVDSWTPGPNDPAVARLRGLLVALRDLIWRPASGFVPRVGRTDDPSADLADVLCTDAVSPSFAVRGLMGEHYLQHLRAFLTDNPDPVTFWQQLNQMVTAISNVVAITGTPFLTQAAHDTVAHALVAPLVGDPSYIAELAAVTDLDALANPVPSAADPLLKVLLRHAILRTYYEEGASLVATADAPVEQLLQDVELIDLVPGQAPMLTWSGLQARPVPGTTTTVRDRLAQTPGPQITLLRSALQQLARFDAPALERQLSSTLDATSHRLDAWITSLATRRLAEQRASQPTGLTVGGYAWVENLRPGAAREPVDPLPGEPGPLATTAGDPGFIHAPSMNQASAAALLRNAHLAHGGTPSSPYAIDLSSGRVRLLRQLFEGVRQGQPLGALLGYLLERRLHEANLDDLIDPLRALAPLPGAATATGVRRIVVDGLALSARWQADPDSVLAPLTATDTRRAAATRILNGLGSAVDAAADGIQAEAAFQMVRGNPTRASTSLEAVSNGQSPPPDLGFLKTPRTGVSVHHRVAMLFDAAPPAPGGGWSTTTPRAQADPVLNAWAGRLLGPADGITARVEELDDAGAVRTAHTVAIATLGLAPIDLLWTLVGPDGAPAEIMRRLIDAAQPGSSPGLRVDVARSGNDRSVSDLLEVATRAQKLLGGARPLDGDDLQPAHTDPVRGLDLDEYEQRANAAEQALAAARAALLAAMQNGTDLRAPMYGVASFGVPGSVPEPSGALEPQARALLVELDRRLTPAAAAPPVDDADRRDQLLARLRAVFGPGFLALPRFRAANAAELAASLADAVALRGDDPLAAYSWMLRMERVRIPLTRFGRPLREAEALGSGERLDLAIAQLPHMAGQRWLGLPLAGDGPPLDGCVSLVLQATPSSLDGPLCGVLVDEWTELIPSRTETTGIAFQYDPPDSVAPQAVLLAVPPVPGEPWTVGSLNRVLVETLDLARLRAVGPEALGDIRHFLPAAYLAFNVDGDAVSSDLAPLTLS